MNGDTLETLAKIDTDDRSLRIERSRFHGARGPRTVLLVSVYTRTRGGQWVRDRALSVRRHELGQLAEKLAEVARSA